MATPTSANTSTDSGYPAAEDDSQRLPSQGSGNATAQNQVDASPTLETAEVFTAYNPLLLPTHNQSMAANAPPMGEMVDAEPERNQAGASMIVGCEQGLSRRDMKSELAEKESAIEDLRKRLRSMSIDGDFKEQEFLVAREEYDNQIAIKNKEIERLQDEMESCKVSMSKLEKTNHEEKVKYESKIRHLEEELNSKKEKTASMMEDFKKKEVKHNKIAAKFELELKLSRMEYDFEKTKRAAAECETEKVKEKLEKKDNPTPKVELMDVRNY